MNQKWNILFKGLAAIGAVIIICISISRLIGIGSEPLGDIARERNCLKKGGDLDHTKAARLLMDEFRSGRLGRITLE